MFIFLCFLLVLSQSVRCSTAPPNKTDTAVAYDPTCQQLKSANLSLLAIGQQRQQVLLITANYRMFRINASQLSPEYLNLSGARSSPMAETWPILGERPSGLLVSDSSSMYLILSPLAGIFSRYDIHHETTLPILAIDLNFSILISTPEPLQFYAIREHPLSGDLQIALLKLNGNSVANSSVIVPLTAFYPLCGFGTMAVVVMTRAEDTCKEKLHWPRMTGFATPNGTIYLFGDRFVLTFSERAFTERGSVHATTSTTTDNFVQCYNIENNSFFQICLIIIIALSSLIFILSCLLCCFQDGLGTKRRKSLEKRNKLKKKYRSCLNQKTTHISTPKQVLANPLNLETKSNHMGHGTRLHVDQPQSKGNVGILIRLHSSESLLQTKRIFSDLGLGIQNTFRKDFNLQSHRN